MSLCVCMSLCLLGQTLSKSKSKIKFLCKLLQKLCHKGRHRHQHKQVNRHTHTLKPYLYTYAIKTGKKGNFLLFGIVIRFQIADLMFGWTVHQSKPWIHLDWRDMFGLLQWHRLQTIGLLCNCFQLARLRFHVWQKN